MRFPKWESPWILTTIQESAPLQRGFDLPASEIRDGSVPVVYSNGVLRFHNQGKAIGPGVITGRSGTIGKFTFIGDGPYWPHNTSLWVTDFKGNDPLFIFYAFQKVGFDKYATGSGVPTLNRNDVMKHVLGLPKVDEQRRIASFLKIIDIRIDAQNKIIEELETLIDSLSNWKNSSNSKAITLSEIAICKTTELKESDLKHDGCYPVYGAKGKCGYLDYPSFIESGVAIIKDGAGVGRCYMIEENGYSILGTMVLLIPKLGIPIEFLWMAIKTISFKKYTVGSGIPHIYYKDYKNASIPDLSKETIKQAKLCSVLLEKLSLEETLLIKMQQEKTYLLKNLFI